MSGHTPGPWGQCVGIGAVEIRGQPTGGQSNPRICRVLRTDPNTEANARLIAAAPRMYEYIATRAETDAEAATILEQINGNA